MSMSWLINPFMIGEEYSSIHLNTQSHLCPSFGKLVQWRGAAIRKSRISDCKHTNKCVCVQNPQYGMTAIGQFSAGQHIQPGPKECLDVCANFLQRIKQIMDKNNHSVYCSNSERLQPSVRDWRVFIHSRSQWEGITFHLWWKLCRYIISSLTGSRCTASVFMHTSQVVLAWNLPDLTIITPNYTSQGSHRSSRRDGPTKWQKPLSSCSEQTWTPQQTSSWQTHTCHGVVLAPEEGEKERSSSGLSSFCQWPVCLLFAIN